MHARDLHYQLQRLLNTLHYAGSVKIGSYSLRGLAVRDIIVTSPEHLGSHVVFKAKSVTLHPSWNIFKGTPYGLHARVICMHAVSSQI